jgi:integrase
MLVVVNNNNASWQLRFERHGRERWLGLGPVGLVGLKAARERARAARLQLLDGIDPIEAKRAARAEAALAAARAITFEEAARQYFDAHERKWKNKKHAAQFLSTLKAYVFPKIGQRSVAAIDTGLVLKAIEPLWLDKDNPRVETANRVRGRIESVLDWATVRGYRQGDNPARWKGHLSEVLPARGQIAKVEHHAALAYEQIGTFMAELAKREGTAARALEFTILCASRTGETMGARWSEIDFAGKVWTVPSGRIKGGREHKVPLSSRAVEILQALPREDDNEFVFIGPRSGGLSNMAMASVLKRMGREDITVHGFRSTFRDWAAERTNYPNHVVEMALAHVVGDKVEAAYRRGDLFAKRIRLMAEWARFCSARPREATATLVPLRRRTR